MMATIEKNVNLLTFLHIKWKKYSGSKKKIHLKFIFSQICRQQGIYLLGTICSLLFFNSSSFIFFIQLIKSFMLSLLPVITLLLLLSPSSPLTLEGNWTLLALPNNQHLNIHTYITELIFRKQEIINKIEFTGCDSLAYQANVVEDNIYINIETERQQSLRECSQEQKVQVNMIKRWIRGVLKFKIVDDKLVIMDPGFDPIFEFRRSQNISKEQWQKSISGSWITQMYNDPSINHIAIADGSQLSICAGAIFNYKITALYHISISLVSQGGCSNQELLSNVQQIAYYQKFEDRLQLYDTNINILFTAIFSPKQITAIPINPQVSPLQKPSSNSANPSSIFTTGRYFLLLLYRRSFGRRSVQITPWTITLQMCSQITFSYKILQNNGVKITSDSIVNSTCSQGDEAYYFNTLISVSKYTIDSDGIVTLIDNNSKSVVSLSMK